MRPVKCACQIRLGLPKRDQGIMPTLFEQARETAHGPLFVHSFYREIKFYIPPRL